MFKIASILPPLETIRIVDVGAMSLGEGNDPYSALLDSAPCEIIGFEPVAREYEKLVAEARPGRVYLPHAVGDGAEHTFHECNYPMTSSLFPPDMEVMGKFQQLGDVSQVVATSPIRTRRLDDMPEVAGADYLKIDVQGAELMVLEGAAELLEGVVVVHTEVEFVPTYKDQPLFGDISAFLRRQGFEFHRFKGMQGRTFKPLIAGGDISGALSQTLWSDAIFVKSFMRFDEVPTPKLLKLATILHENYRSLDLAALALSAVDAREGTGYQPAYLGHFGAR